MSWGAIAAELHWRRSMALGREEEVEWHTAAMVAEGLERNMCWGTMPGLGAAYAAKEGAVCRIQPPRDDDGINNTGPSTLVVYHDACDTPQFWGMIRARADQMESL